MTYQQCLEYLKNIESCSYTPSHENSVQLMRYLDNVHNSLPVIHIAGTNGKGSTLRYIKEILMASHYSVGAYVSPHFLDYREMIESNDQLIDPSDFAIAVTTVKDACDQMVNDGLNHPTFYECITATALVHFSRAEHDFVLIEALMGGKDDATNVFKKPLLCVITPISYDHEAFLGSSLSEIAVHKSGIIKKDTPVVLAPNPIEVVSIVSSKVKETKGFLYLLDEGLIHSQTLVNHHQLKIFNLKTPFYEYKNLHTSMFGRHQEINMATALLVIEQLKKKIKIPQEAIYQGIKIAKWSCRNELLSMDPLILLDGGHNPAGSLAIKSLIHDHYKAHRIITLFGVLSDKDYPKMMEILSSFSDEIILTSPSSDRALDPATINVATDCPQEVHGDIETALSVALSKMDKNTLLLVTGSLSLVQPAKLWLTDQLAL